MPQDKEVSFSATGVKCSAHHCLYNDKARHICTAQQIDIGGVKACCRGETSCETFKMK